MGKFKVPRRIIEAKMTIWRWIKFKDKSEKPYKTKTRQNIINKRSRYCPRYHTGSNKGQ